MSILQTSGIQFGDNTILNSKYGIIPQGSVAVFYQASAPNVGLKLIRTQIKHLEL